MAMFNERQVVTRILQGDLRAFTELVKQYERLVFYVIKRLLNEKEDLEDVTQEVFIKVYRSIAVFEFQSKLSTWIARIAYLTAVNHLKKYKNERSKHYPDDLDQIHFTTMNPGTLLAKKDIMNYLEQLIAQLPEKYRTVITLYHLKEFSYTEIGEITGLNDGTVKTHLFRARQLLKEKIGIHLKDELL